MGGSIRSIFSSFQTRIIFLVILITFLSLGLGAVLGALSFEKVYLKTLTSKYVILGKDLRRKIEQSLKFGKDLKTFMGMDKLVEPLRGQAGELAEVFLTLQDGTIVFPEELAGQKRALVLEAPLDWDKKEAVVVPDRERYHVLMTLAPPLGGRMGVLDLSFGKSVVERKTRKLVREMAAALAVALVAAGIVIQLMIKYLVVAPMRRQIDESGFSFLKDPNEFMESSIPDELTEVQICGAAFVAKTKVFAYKFEFFLDELTRDLDLSEEARQELAELKLLTGNKDYETA
ncbi:MAG: hypothetical protein V1816_01695 [Pseudomonadota bacterium]